MLFGVIRLRNAGIIVFTGIHALVVLPSAAQPLFQRNIGMSSFDKGSSIKVLPDGGFIIGGETENTTDQERDMMLIRTDSMGNVTWLKSYGGPEREVVNDVLQTADRGFLFTAEKYQPHKMEGENLAILKTDATGALTWKKIYEEGGNETEGFTIQHTHDNAYVVAGMVKNMSMVSSAFFNMSAENQGMYLLKIDGSGNKIWSRRFDYGGNNVSTTGTSAVVTSDGSYVITGNVTKKGTTDKKIERPAEAVNMTDVRNALLVKVKPDGSLQWAKEYEANPITMGVMVIEKRDGGLMVAGNTNVTATNLDVFLMSLGADGTVQWAKTLGGPRFESVADVVETPDGGFVVSAMSESFGSGSTDILNFKVDSKGTVVWSKSYGGGNADNPSKLALTATGIVTVGTTSSFKSESYDVLLMKTDWNGNGQCLGNNVTLNVGNFQPVLKKIEKPAMNKVEQGVPPPNMKKPDASNMLEKKCEPHAKNLCDK